MRSLPSPEAEALFRDLMRMSDTLRQSFGRNSWRFVLPKADADLLAIYVTGFEFDGGGHPAPDHVLGIPFRVDEHATAPALELAVPGHVTTPPPTIDGAIEVQGGVLRLDLRCVRCAQHIGERQHAEMSERLGSLSTAWPRLTALVELAATHRCPEPRGLLNR